MGGETAIHQNKKEVMLASLFENILVPNQFGIKLRRQYYMGI